MLDFFKKIFYKKSFKPQKTLIQSIEPQQTTAEIINFSENRIILKCDQFNIYFTLKKEEIQKALKIGDNIDILIKKISFNNMDKIIGYDINVIKGE